MSKKTNNLILKYFLCSVSLVLQLFWPQAIFAQIQHFSDFAEAKVTVGTPQTSCPSGWPMEHGHMSQGPTGLGSHYDNAPEQPIDIGSNDTDTPTYATFDGVVSEIGTSRTVGYGVYVKLQSECNGTQITVIWAHLNSIDPAAAGVGNQVRKDQLIGKIDDTGHSFATHLHYGFWGIPMAEPYIPQTPIPSNCGDSHTDCNISW